MLYTLLIVSENKEHYELITQALQHHDKNEQIATEYCGSIEDAINYLDENVVSMIIVQDSMILDQEKKFLQTLQKHPMFLDKPLSLIVTLDGSNLDGFDPKNNLYLPLKTKKTYEIIIQTLDKYYEQNRLIEEMFHQSSEHKQQMNLLKDRMLLIFTHELKTPLNAIINFSSYINRGLQKKLTRSKVDKFIELSKLIQINGEVLLEEINTLLDIAKLKEQKMTFSLENVHLDQLIEQSIEKYKLLYNKQINTNIQAVQIYSDKKSLVHIFENLYSNALKYSHTQINIELKQKDDQFILSVEDDGNGIKKDQKHTIFDLFEQTEQTILNREKEGTGIGLYIVKLLCEHFKYNITVEDSNLGGVLFIIRGKIQ